MRLSSLSMSLLMSSLLVSSVATARSKGISGKAQTGCVPCHGAEATAGVTAVLAGADTLTVHSEGEYTLTLEGGPAAAAGFNVRVEPPDALSFVPREGQQILGGELTHLVPVLPEADGSFIFPFTLRAGATAGDAVLYAAANSVNLDLARTGDAFAVTQIALTLVVPEEKEVKTLPPEPLPDEVSPRSGCGQGGQILLPWALLLTFLRRRRPASFKRTDASV